MIRNTEHSPELFIIALLIASKDDKKYFTPDEDGCAWELRCGEDINSPDVQHGLTIFHQQRLSHDHR